MLAVGFVDQVKVLLTKLKFVLHEGSELLENCEEKMNKINTLLTFIFPILDYRARWLTISMVLDLKKRFVFLDKTRVALRTESSIS